MERASPARRCPVPTIGPEVFTEVTMPLLFFIDAAMITINWYLGWGVVCYNAPDYCPVG
jgi:hypothetical protein